MSIYSDVRNLSNDSSAAIALVANLNAEAAKLETDGAKSVAAGMILRVASISSMLRAGVVTYENRKLGLSTAVSGAAALFDRVLKECEDAADQPLQEFNPKDAREAHNAVRTYVSKLLHPYRFDRLDWDISDTRSKIINLHGKDHNRADLIKALDATDTARQNAAKAFDLACLYTYLDRSGESVEKFDKKLGLLARSDWFLPIVRDKAGHIHAVEPAGKGGAVPVYIKAAAGSHVMVTGYYNAGALLGEHTPSYRASLAQMAEAWKLPRAGNVTADRLTNALKVIGETLKADAKLDATGKLAFSNAYKAMNAYALAHGQAQAVAEGAKVAGNKASLPAKLITKGS